MISKPPGAVAWIATPHAADGMTQVSRGLARMFDDKNLLMGPGDAEGYWIVKKETTQDAPVHRQA